LTVHFRFAAEECLLGETADAALPMNKYWLD
jgi:hypothetical protein